MPRNIDDGAAHLVSTLTDTLIQAVQDPELLADISDDELDALRAEVVSARSAAESKEALANVRF